MRKTTIVLKRAISFPVVAEILLHISEERNRKGKEEE